MQVNRFKHVEIEFMIDIETEKSEVGDVLLTVDIYATR